MKPTVLLHGWGMNSGCWNLLRQCADPSLQLISPNLPGHGTACNDIFPDELDELAEMMLEQQSEPAIWVGWSLGGLVAMRAAILEPRQVLGLVLICTTPKFIQADDWAHGTELSVLQAFASEMQLNPAKGLKRFLLLMLGNNSRSRQAAKQLTVDLANQGNPSDRAIQGGLKMLAEVDLRKHVGEIKMPVRVLSAHDDSICPAGAGRWLTENLNCPYELVAGGHAPLATAPTVVLNEIAMMQEQICRVG